MNDVAIEEVLSNFVVPMTIPDGDFQRLLCAIIHNISTFMTVGTKGRLSSYVAAVPNDDLCANWSLDDEVKVSSGCEQPMWSRWNYIVHVNNML